MQFWHFTDKWNNISKKFHQTSYSHIFAGTYTENREYGTCYESLAYTFPHFILCQCLFLEKFLHKTLIILSSRLDKNFMQFHCLFFFFLWNFLYNRHTSVRTPRIFLHQQYIYQRVESASGTDRILNLYAFRSIYALHIRYNVIEIAFIRVKLINKKYNRFLKFFSISEVVLCSDFGTILSVYKNHGLVCNIQCCNRTSDKII